MYHRTVTVLLFGNFHTSPIKYSDLKLPLLLSSLVPFDNVTNKKIIKKPSKKYEKLHGITCRCIFHYCHTPQECRHILEQLLLIVCLLVCLLVWLLNCTHSQLPIDCLQTSIYCLEGKHTIKRQFYSEPFTSRKQLLLLLQNVIQCIVG